MNNVQSFPIPASLLDLESTPYNLLPYPSDFDDDDETTRAASFDALVDLLEDGNRSLKSYGLGLFEVTDGEEDLDPWNDRNRIQALYTLVRKSDSLASMTRKRLVKAICDAVRCLCSALANPGALQSQSESQNSEDDATGTERDDQRSLFVVSQSFRDALACQIYMLFTLMFFNESHEKLGKSLGNVVKTGKSKSAKSHSSAKDGSRKSATDGSTAQRTACAEAMKVASQTMAKYKTRLWKRGVPDEAVVGLPCRIAYQMMECATGQIARKASSCDCALAMIAATADSVPSLMSTILAALVDLLHSHEHMAPLVAELCCIVNETPTNILATELLREIGRLDTAGFTDNGGKASGLKNVAPFLSELARVRPQIVLKNISLVIPHLDSEPYVFRSSIVHAIGHILVRPDQSLLEGDDENPSCEGDSDEEHEKQRDLANIAKARSALFDILCQRTHDVTSFTRAAALKVLYELMEKQSIPLDRIMPVTAIAIDRLQDKAVMVRRYSMQLLTTILENNPYMGALDPEAYRRKISELEEYLKSNIAGDILKAKDNALDEAKDNDGSDIDFEEIQSAALAAAIADAESKADSGHLSQEETSFLAKVRAYKYASSALSFIELFENANSSFQTMLLSSNPSDVTEALRFFVKAKHFNLPCAVTGMKRALALMWSNENSVREEVLNAFVDVFIAEPGTEGKILLPPNRIAHNLQVLAYAATVSELASIEEAIGRLVKKELIPPEVFSILWDLVAQAEGEVKASAMLVISMGANADPKIVDSAFRLQNLHDTALGQSTEEHRDWATVKSASYALQRVARATGDPSSAKSIILDLIIERLIEVVRGDWCRDSELRDTTTWFSAAEQAINAIFAISPAPEEVSMEILRGHEAGVFGLPGERARRGDSLRLSRFFFVLGHVALKLLIYTEVLSSSVRRANAAKTISKQESVTTAKKGNNDSEAMAGSGSDDDDDAIEAELGIAAQAEAETERKVAEISENEIVGRGVISLYTPLLLRVVANEDGLYNSPVLMQAATLALCKCMCISKSFCENHLSLLFSVLANAPNDDQNLRANIVVALGDLAFRFPNEVEPYTPKIYACLRDKSTRVRRHTLMVLTHLILNDMVKVKGQVCEVALCLQDQELQIRDIAKLLFYELSKRTNNPIYNLLPDIISQLSQLELHRDAFREIMLFLLGFIKKDRQNEMLMEKLLLRFPKCVSIGQKADLAFCVAQLKVNDKSMKCLNDMFKLYKDALFDDDVLRSFISIVNKAKKLPKLDSRDALQELEDKLNKNASVGIENLKASKKAQKAKARAAKRVARKKEWEGDTDEDEVSDEDENEENRPENTRLRRSNRSRRRGVV